MSMDLVVGTAYIREVKEGPDVVEAHLAGTVYHVPISNHLAAALSYELADADLPQDLICEDEFGNAYLWVIGG